MFVCPTVSDLRFYGCCHPCLKTKSEFILLQYRKSKRQMKRNYSPICYIKDLTAALVGLGNVIENKLTEIIHTQTNTKRKEKCW